YLYHDPWFWHNPYYASPFVGRYAPGAGKGEIRLETEEKSAEVYIDDAYAGLAGERKTMWLAPGAYNISLRMEGREPYEKRVYVLSGKRLRLRAELAEQEDKQ
ncbi:MAG: PEGA domain-containing protein, partial [bacterium]|nr:PEGA domain-containing protein [bacterium]